MFRSIPIILSLLFSSLAHSQSDDETRSVVTLFGDSITVGFNGDFQDRDGNGTTDRGCTTLYLTSMLLNQGPRLDDVSCRTDIHSSPILDSVEESRNAIVVNWGEGGTTSERGLSQISSVLDRVRLDHEGQQYIVLIMYGTNDPNEEISASTTGFNNREMIRRAKLKGFSIAVSNLTPRSDRSVIEYNNQIRSVALSEGVNFIDMYSKFFNYNPGGFTTLIDLEINSLTNEVFRLHPNDQGYLVIAETWFDQALKDLIPVVEQDPIHMTQIISILLDD